MTNNVGRIFEFEDSRTGGSMFINASERFTYRDADIIIKKIYRLV